MQHAAAQELAYRTALSAGTFVGALASDVHEVSYALRSGDVGAGLESLEAQTDRLQRFLTFLVVSSEIMLEERDPVGAVLGDYARRLLAIVTRVESALDGHDMTGLAVTLEHGLARALSEYVNYEDDVTRSLESRAAA